MRRSRVMLTAPSVEFSTGTTPYSTRECSTSSKMSATVRPGVKVAPLPKYWRAAWCVNVARGPKYPTVSGPSSARQPDRISRQTARIVDADNGPPLALDRRLTISASRSGAYDGKSCRRLRSPIWRAASARWLRRLRIWLSRSLILERQSSRFIRTPDRSSLANTKDYRLLRADGASVWRSVGEDAAAAVRRARTSAAVSERQEPTRRWPRAIGPKPMRRRWRTG